MQATFSFDSANLSLIADSIFSSCWIENVCGIQIFIFIMIFEAALQSCFAEVLQSLTLLSSSMISVAISVNCFVFRPKSSKSQLQPALRISLIFTFWDYKRISGPFSLFTGHFLLINRPISSRSLASIYDNFLESLADSCIDSVAIFLVSRLDLDPLLNVLLAQLRIFSEAASIDCRPGR